MSYVCWNRSSTPWIFRPIGYERVYLTLSQVADTPFHIEWDELLIIMSVISGRCRLPIKRDYLTALTLHEPATSSSINLSPEADNFYGLFSFLHRHTTITKLLVHRRS